MFSDLQKLLNRLPSQPRSVKTFIGISLDFACSIFSVWVAYYLRLGDFVSLSERGSSALILSILIAFPIFYFFGLYKTIFRYSGINSLLTVSRAMFSYSIIYTLLISFIGIRGIPRTLGIIQPLLLLVLICSWRLLVRYILRKLNNDHYAKNDVVNALVYGAGKAGRQLVRAMQENTDISLKGFIDDDLSQQGCKIDGKLIYPPDDISKLILKKDISLILLALPSIPKKQRTKIIRNLTKYKIAIRSIPEISEIAKGERLITEFVDLDIDDLIDRVEVEPFQSLMKKNIFQKTILVTGSGGSIGSELCRQIIRFKPKILLLVEISEYALYTVHYELEQLKSSEIEILPLIGSVQDKRRMEEIISIWKPATIYHAAAYKHVPIVEYNLIEGLKNNVLGTFELAKLASINKVSNFVFISTDKAVRPTNIMGATKRLAELCLQALNKKYNQSNIENKKTKFSIVRFGNVLDSSGSVIPKFRDQIKKGGPLTLTHQEITRYFMTITEAAQLVIQAGALAKGGDVFILDMGQPVKIYDLAVRMVEFSGLSVKDKLNNKGDIEIQITGLRPGEKLYEELLLSENPRKTKHPKIFRSEEPFIEYSELEKEINALKEIIMENDLENIRKKLKKVVIDYYPNSKIDFNLFYYFNNFRSYFYFCIYCMFNRI